VGKLTKVTLPLTTFIIPLSLGLRPNKSVKTSHSEFKAVRGQATNIQVHASSGAVQDWEGTGRPGGSPGRGRALRAHNRILFKLITGNSFEMRDDLHVTERACLTLFYSLFWNKAALKLLHGSGK
jgi:hypothetical protein